ncbi:subtilase-type serine protease [Stenotrophomonas maltophilia]|uniref:autotransporter domain-containing protein n=1 Tax=Stenotrophomonas chelatiphaga TaxID=517011 RepID=UPI000F4C9188|nr:autotransporter serine protease [Stenotrophomonas chelatiphaga]MCS4230008.1 subtilase-type serine protease [Stenotrophomonas chelatiphaga]ROQ45769.1 subtilase-type serine protease [Stenotrophomonas maltophilia]
MTRTTLFRTSSSSRRPLPSLLASAIAGSLLVAAAMPALAQSQDAQLEHYQQLRSVQAAAASVAQGAVARPPATALASAAETGPVMGAAGNRESWQTEEFQVDWGLAAMNADAAYARGLTGQGIRLGVFDSGTGLAHDEFAGKNHSSIRIADLLPDGTSCTNVNALWGPDACFASDGDVVALEAIGFDYGLTEEDIAFLIGAGAPYGLTFNTHGTHVSGTIAANRDGSGMHGVAFGADLAAAKLFFDSYVEWYLAPDNYYRQGSVFPQVGPSEDAFASMYSQMNAQGVRAINHSWGLGSEPETVEEFDEIYNHEGDRAYLDIFAEGSRQAGMIQVWAAGNSADYNPSPEEAPLAGVYATLPRAFADIEPYWLAVVNLNQDLQLSDLSHRCGLAANWCLAAPGSDIISTSYGSEGLEGQLATDDNQNVLLDVLERVPSYTYEQMSGTSMAAPHVTGALGLLFERFPYLDNAQVRDVLLTTATDLGAEGVDDVYGWGLVNLEKAIEGYGQLRVDTNVVMKTAAGGLKVWEGDAWDDWTNDIGGPGALTKSGIGWLRLSGDNSFNGAVLREGILELDGVNTLTDAVVVQGGQLRLNGSLVGTDLDVRGGSGLVAAGALLDGSSLSISGGMLSFNGTQTGGSTVVGANGLLQGTGTLGDTRVAGIIAPGNSIGTLTIDGDYVQTASGVYLAELSPGGSSDLLRVSGTATLDGTLKALPEAGIYYLGEQFNVIQADGGVQGRFASTDFSAFSPFLQFGVGYASNGINIEVTRGQLLATAATTANQRAVAGSADALGVDQGLPQPLTLLFPQQVGAALDGLSGELHAATPLALVESSRYVRDAALSRAVGARSPQDDASQATGAWVQAIGGSGKLDGDANTARTQSNTSGLLVGIDRDIGGWQLGLLLGNGRTDTKQAQGRSAKARIDNTHVGLYAGHSWGAFGLRGGLGYSRHDIDSSRQVAFAGYSDGLNASYDAKTKQAFIEAGYRFGGTQGGLEPYLQLARVEVDVDDVREQGGAAALTGRVADTATTVATVGVRFDKGLKAAFQQDAWLHVVGGVGYRRASGDRDGLAQLAFDGGSSFAVSGAPIADSAVVAELGLSAWLSPRQQLELGYNGQFGDESRDHGVNARWSVRF